MDKCKESKAKPTIASEEARISALADAYGLGFRARDMGTYAIWSDVAGWLIECDDLGDVQRILNAYLLSVIAPRPAAELVYEAAREAGSQKALAARLGVSPSFISDIIRGRKAAPDGLMRKLGLKASTVYIKETPMLSAYTTAQIRLSPGSYREIEGRLRAAGADAAPEAERTTRRPRRFAIENATTANIEHLEFAIVRAEEALRYGDTVELQTASGDVLKNLEAIDEMERTLERLQAEKEKADG